MATYRIFCSAKKPGDAITSNIASKSTQDIQNIEIYNFITVPDVMSTHFCSLLSDISETGRVLFTDFFHPSSFFNSAHIASLSESGVSRATSRVCVCVCAWVSVYMYVNVIVYIFFTVREDKRIIHMYYCAYYVFVRDLLLKWNSNPKVPSPNENTWKKKTTTTTEATTILLCSSEGEKITKQEGKNVLYATDLGAEVDNGTFGHYKCGPIQGHTFPLQRKKFVGNVIEQPREWAKLRSMIIMRLQMARKFG